MATDQLDVASALPAEVTMRSSDGSEQTIIRKPLRDVFCTKCGVSVGEERRDQEHDCEDL